jgi:hypothetical protein
MARTSISMTVDVSPEMHFYHRAHQVTFWTGQISSSAYTWALRCAEGGLAWMASGERDVSKHAAQEIRDWSNMLTCSRSECIGCWLDHVFGCTATPYYAQVSSSANIRSGVCTSWQHLRFWFADYFDMAESSPAGTKPGRRRVYFLW